MGFFVAIRRNARNRAPGTPASAVDNAAREILRSAGFECPHYLGHGLGHSQFDYPLIDSTSTAVLEEGHVVALEPGVYLPGVVAVRVEHVFRITSTGADRLTDHSVLADLAAAE
jgi:Xaa-Pro dipeptidase